MVTDDAGLVLQEPRFIAGNVGKLMSSKTGARATGARLATFSLENYGMTISCKVTGLCRV